MTDVNYYNQKSAVEQAEEGHIRELTVADFEGGTLPQDAVGDTGDATVQNGTVLEGDYSLKLSQSSTGEIVLGLESDRDSLPQLGDRWVSKFYLTDTDDIVSFNWAQNPVNINLFNGTGIEILLRADRDTLDIQQRQDGTVINSDTQNISISNYLNEVLTVKHEASKDGAYEITLEDSTGIQLGTASVSLDKGVYEPGGVQYGVMNNSTAPTIYFDGPLNLKRREPEAAVNTKKGTTDLGNEVTPSGAIQTGPTTAPLNTERAIYQDAPVNSNATQGTESILTLLQSGVNPAMYMERTFDGQGGAYGNQLQTALGRFARINANLSWEYDSLVDVPNWESEQGGVSNWTFNLNGFPRRIHVEHDGSAGSDVYGGVVASALTSFQSLNGFRVTFSNVSFSENSTNNRVIVGVTDQTPSKELRFKGNGAIIEFLSSSLDPYVINSGSSDFSSGAAIDWTKNHDVAIEYDGSTVLFLIDGVEKSSNSYTVNSDFSPIIQLQDKESETESETVEVEQITVEPLPEVLQ